MSRMQIKKHVAQNLINKINTLTVYVPPIIATHFLQTKIASKKRSTRLVRNTLIKA